MAVVSRSSSPAPPRARARARARAGKREGDVKPAQEEEDVRGRVLSAAVTLIDKVGLAGVSMREVARAAGVSHQAPYHYFEDREAIFAALAEEGFKILTVRLESSIETMEPAVDRFVRAGQTYVEFAFDHPALFRLMFRPDMVTMDRFPDVRECGERAFQIVPRLVQACIAEGLPAEPSVQALVILAWSIPHGLACLALDGPLEKKIPDLFTTREQLTREVMMAMRNLLRARSTPRPAKARAKAGTKAGTKAGSRAGTKAGSRAGTSAAGSAGAKALAKTRSSTTTGRRTR